MEFNHKSITKNHENTYTPRECNFRVSTEENSLTRSEF
jgi:hypothetical protein